MDGDGDEVRNGFEDLFVGLYAYQFADLEGKRVATSASTIQPYTTGVLSPVTS